MKLLPAYCFCVLVSSLCLHFTVPAQKLYFQSYNTSQRLSQNSVYSIAQTKEGFMWFGTQDGINRFDVKNFTVISPVIKGENIKETGGTKFSKIITALYEDNNDWLWVGTAYETLSYNRYINAFILRGNIYKGLALPNGLWINKITEDSSDKVWILSQKDWLYCYSKRLQSMLHLSWLGAVPGKIITLALDAAGNRWVCSETEIFHLDGSTFRPITLHNNLSYGNNRILDICVINGIL